MGSCCLEVKDKSGRTEEKWISNTAPRTKSPGLKIMLELNGACSSQEEEEEEAKREKKENNIKYSCRYESRCMSREAIMSVLPPLLSNTTLPSLNALSSYNILYTALCHPLCHLNISHLSRGRSRGRANIRHTLTIFSD